MIDPDLPTPAPVIVGGIGGSGTRAGVALLRVAGIWMGDKVDPMTEDSLTIRSYLNYWFNQILRWVIERQGIPEPAFRDFRSAVIAHLENFPGSDTPWGWKNPRSLWILPFYSQMFPRLRFIHMIRDVRDMATSANDTLLRNSARILLAKNWTDDPHLAQIRLWTLGNTLARHHATSIFGKENYFLLRYEDLCAEPRPTIEGLFGFLGVPFDYMRLMQCVPGIRPSARLGRWRKEDTLRDVRLDVDTVKALESFGYPV